MLSLKMGTEDLLFQERLRVLNYSGSGRLLRSNGQDETLKWEGIFGKIITDLPFEFLFHEFDSSNSTASILTARD